MAIEPGTRIGPYEVTSPLGEGGMGVVLRARDTKLLRDVALKVLPDQFASDPDRLSRLEREAQLLASLNHPNIAQVYGLEQFGGAGCIVMELVEGETLDERLKNGPLTVDDALEIARQIVDALSAAHERGIVHRDLKPANIKLTPNGTVKVLDFGLAKALAGRGVETQFSTMPTKVSGSVAGAIVGTVGYMSPEQARGKEVDARTDIWAFGCVLYEMLTAKAAFDGETTTDVMARIVTAQPDLNLLPDHVPPSIRLLLEAAFNKNVQQRLQHIGDVRLFFDPKFFQTTPAPASVTAAQPARSRFLPAVLAAALALTLIPAVLYFLPRPAAVPSQMHFEMSLPGIVGSPLISPDGQRIAYVVQADDNTRSIWIRPIGRDNSLRLAGTENVTGTITFSADSNRLAFQADGKLKKIDVAGGSVQTIADLVGNIRGFAWNRSGSIFFGRVADNVIVRISDTGGEATPVTALDAGRKENFHVGPVFLPDHEHFIYGIVSAVPENSGIFIGSVGSKSPITRLMPPPPNLNMAAYAPPGHILMLGSQKLTAQRIDVKNFKLEGEPVLIAEEVVGAFSVSDTGLLFYRKGLTVPPSDQLIWFDRTGKQLGQVGENANYGGVELSPKGDRVAVDMTTNDNRDIWVIDIARGVPSRVTFDAGAEWSPSWSPDGSRLVFPSSRGTTHMYEKSSSGMGEQQLVFKTDKSEVPVHWSPDGRYILFSRGKAGSTNQVYDTWLFDTVTKKESIYLESQFDKVHARVSPDGRWMAYATNDSGMYQIVVQSFPNPTLGKWQITAQGGVEPKWRKDGRELYFLAYDGKLMAVPVKTAPAFEAGTPVALFETPLAVTRPQLASRDRRYDVSPDGRFLIVAPMRTAVPRPVIAVVNWASGLQ